MAQCDYWWFAGEVEWCDLRGDSCKCGGWHESCYLRGKGQALADEKDLPVRAPSRLRQDRYARHPSPDGRP
ncbi:MAG: hypothetical protein Q7T82_01445 [Armatimonadota bacterium]|nr:hypothetical protein [Armatimonadota bacterium]